MRYILIGNNKNIDEKTIDKINIENDDCIILFNHCYPLKFERIKNHNNKVVFIRRNHLKSYWGIEEVIQNFSLFEKIFPFSTNHKVEQHIKSLNEIVEKKNINEKNIILSKIDFESINFIKKILKNLVPKYNKKKIPTTGFIAYQYFKNIKEKNDVIFLLGFTLVYDNNILGGSECHDGNYEIDYYKNDLINTNLVKIDS